MSEVPLSSPEEYLCTQEAQCDSSRYYGASMFHVRPWFSG